MPENAGNPLSFWQELKRRKVVRVITVYAAAAFVILELVDILSPSLGLPTWTLNFILVLLCVGFILAVILSWIYDITPEGIEKTKPVDEIREKVPEKPSQLNAWKIATIISVVVIVGLIIFHTVGERKQAEDLKILDKSIAVLPFKSLSDDPEKQYLADGAMDAILLHLSKIKDLRVMARTSVEQYRETDKTASTICQELDVAYLLEGSFQKYGDQARLIVQLIEPGKEGHLWAKEYDRSWRDIFSVQSEIAQHIAHELNAIITPKEKKRIERVPTSSLTAYDLHQRSVVEYEEYLMKGNLSARDRAENLLRRALEYDSAYASCYVTLAGIHRTKLGSSTSSRVDHFDSCFQLLNIALSYNDALPSAYTHKGIYYCQTGQVERGIAEYDKALESDPNYYQAYIQKGAWHMNYYYDFVESIHNMYMASRIHRGHRLPETLGNIAVSLYYAGFPRLGKQYQQKVLELDGDSAEYFYQLAKSEHYQANFQRANELFHKTYQTDTSKFHALGRLGENYLYQNQYENSLLYFHQYIEKTNYLESIQIHHIGYAFLLNGFDEEARHYLQRQINDCNSRNETGTYQAVSCGWTYHWLAACYSALGDYEKVIENLQIAVRKDKLPLWMVNDLKNDPIYDKVRDEQEFQQIVKDSEAKYQAVHERVKKWLEENDML